MRQPYRRGCHSGHWDTFAYRGLWNMRLLGRRHSALMLAARITLGPLLGLFSDQLAEVRGRARKRDAAEISNASLNLGVGESLIDFLVELLDNFRGRVLWRADAIEKTRLVTRDEISNGGQVWHCR